LINASNELVEERKTKRCGTLPLSRSRSCFTSVSIKATHFT